MLGARSTNSFSSGVKEQEKLNQAYNHLIMASFFAVASVAALAIFEKLLFGSYGFYDRAPEFNAYSFLRSSIATLLSALLLAPFYTRFGFGNGATSTQIDSQQQSVLWALIALVAVFVAILVASPTLFSEMAIEDRGVEWASALALLAACVLFLRMSLRLWKIDQQIRRSSTLLPFAGSLVGAGMFFVLGMEEVSWMQRIFGYDTPEAMQELNQQKEFNFHNILTDKADLCYYMGAFVFLVLMPFLFERFGTPTLLSHFSSFLPGTFTMASGAFAVPFNYDMWHLVPVQISVITTLVIMLLCSACAPTRKEATLFAAIFVLLVSTQALLILFGPELVRLWDATEYKELFIALGFACYAWEVASRMRAEPAARLAIARASQMEQR